VLPIEKPVRPAGSGRVRVGFASSFFRTCTVGSYFGPWVTGLDRERFEVFAFYFGSANDATTAAIRGGVGQFVDLPHDARRIAAAIRSAGLDVLVYPQLGMDGLDGTLGQLRLAPVQCVAWGHPETTGSALIDCFLSCAEMEPADPAGHYAERLRCLPGLGTRYALPDSKAMTRTDLGLPGSGRLNAGPHSLFKIHPDNDRMFADVLLSDPAGTLVFCADGGQPVTAQFRARLDRTLAQHEVDVERRVVFQPLRTPAEFRALLSVCDVMLDTLHWSGGNTSLDALAAGLPIVSCPGPMMRGRQSAAMLRAIGLPDLVATDPAHAVRIAIDVACESGPAIRRQIVRDRGALFGRDEPIRALAQTLLELTGK
jgi:CRISPR-associated protein Csy1